MSGRTVQQKQSFLADKKGQKIGSDAAHPRRRPAHPSGGSAAASSTATGIAARRRDMIEAGVLRDFYVDWYYSRKLGWEPTTGGPSNLIIPPGKRSVAEIMKDLGRGILVTGFHRRQLQLHHGRRLDRHHRPALREGRSPCTRSPR